ncbi:zinc ribbon domain-containing protein [Caenispirillum bisanense]|uniref:FmdB family zinc ribbon protein n=1 Tax=Caenispirillum bisanense TaxID=414052 RepID=UPI0031DF92FB
MTTDTAPGTAKDPLDGAARELRARIRYVSARDELTAPDSTINKAAADEPVFVLRARDLVASMTVEYWEFCARNRGTPDDKLERADRQRRAMEAWLEKRLPQPTPAGEMPTVRTAHVERTHPHSVLRSAHPEEPVFAIVASDAVAQEVVEFWAFMAERNGAKPAKVEAALQVARAMAAWTSKRVVGLQERKPRPVLSDASAGGGGTVLSSHRPHHRKVTRIRCLACGHTEKVGEPPYSEELLASIAETCDGPCPSCGAQPVAATADAPPRRVLTTELVDG